ncbi:MAG TPA: TIGR01777 family oxidoreductase [Verrucomicrobiae bacterium]
MNILVTGASGLIGKALVARLAEGGHRVVPLRRAASGGEAGPTWNPQAGQICLESDKPLDAVIHLAGEHIAQRWTAAAKARIRGSRVDATRLLCEALARLPQPPRVLVSASATGYYGDRGDEVLVEDSSPGNGFLAEVCQAWEAAAEPARLHGIRVVYLRLGIVLAHNGGALAKMLPAFRLGFGGRLGSGRQFWSWICLEDLLRVIEFALGESSLSGAVNAVSLETVTNAQFTGALARTVRRPAWLPMPAIAVKVLFGEMGREALLGGARVRPARLIESGFLFRFPELEAALNHTLGRPES